MIIITPRLLNNKQLAFDIDGGPEHQQRAAPVIPSTFYPLKARAWSSVDLMSCWTFYKLRNALAGRLDELEDFCGLVGSPALESLTATAAQWREFALFAMRRIDRLFEAMRNEGVGVIDPTTLDGVAQFVKFCSGKMTSYWQSTHGNLSPIYDMEGLQVTVSRLPTIKERRSLLNRVLREMSGPVRCELGYGDRTIDKPEGSSVPGIYIVWFHALSYSDLDQIQGMVNELQERIDEEFRQTVLVTSQPQGQIGNPLGHGTHRKLLLWKGKQADLIYVMDRLIEAGLLEATSAEITEHFDYGSNSKDPSKTYRDMRKKLKDGQTYPSKEKIDRLIQILQRDLR